MATLTDSLHKLADDEACMRQVSQRSGIEVADGRSAYLAAVDTVIARLETALDEPEAMQSLLAAARHFDNETRGGPRAQFLHRPGTDDDQLTTTLFGPQLTSTTAALAADQRVSTDKAQKALEVATSVALAELVSRAGVNVTEDAVRPAITSGARRPVATVASAGAAPAKPRSRAMLVALPVLLVAGVVAVLVATGGGDDGETDLAFVEDPTTTTAPEADDEPSTTASSASPVSTAAAPEPEDTDDASDAGITTAEDADDADDATEATSESESESESPPSPVGAPENHTVVSRGTVFLRGHVPNDEVEGLIVAAVEGFAGEGNVVSEYELDPTRPYEQGRPVPVYIDDTVLFATGSAELNEQFLPVLGLGLTLLQLQPGVTLEVTGHTDSDGDAAANLALSQARVDAVKGFFVSQGIEAERITAIGKGETEPRVSNETAEGRQANRRVEFLVEGFSFG